MSDVGDDGYLETARGNRIPQLTLTSSMIIDRSIVLYGPSNTGKTVIVKHILNLVLGQIEQAFVISPTEPTNQSYKGIIEAPFIHYRLHMSNPEKPNENPKRSAIRWIEAVWARSSMMAEIYKRINNERVLVKLFERLPKSVVAAGMVPIMRVDRESIETVRRVKKQFATDLVQREKKVAEVAEMFKNMVVLLYKKYITPYRDQLWGHKNLTADERYTLQYLHFNPKVILIFDDCAAELRPLFNEPIFRKLFYQNRHKFITVVIVCQDDTDLNANLRKNAFVSFYTSDIVASANFDRSSNNYSKVTKKLVADILPTVFASEFRKLAYLRDDNTRQHFYHIEVPNHTKFKFCSNAARELCEKVAKSGNEMDITNPYYDDFKV